MKQSKIKKVPFWDNESKNLLIQKIEERLLEFGLSRTKQKQKYNKERFEGFSWSLVYGNIVKGNRTVKLETINDIALCLGLKTDTSKVGQIRILEHGEK